VEIQTRKGRKKGGEEKRKSTWKRWGRKEGNVEPAPRPNDGRSIRRQGKNTFNSPAKENNHWGKGEKPNSPPEREIPMIGGRD